jgi:hypothetical protein
MLLEFVTGYNLVIYQKAPKGAFYLNKYSNKEFIMIDQLTNDELAYFENRYGKIEYNPVYEPTARERKMTVTLFTGNRLAHGVEQSDKFILTDVQDLD